MSGHSGAGPGGAGSSTNSGGAGPSGSSANQGANGGAAGSNAPQNLNNIVIEYLLKKGYYKTETSLRQESSNADENGRPIITKVEDFGSQKYSKAFKLLKDWIESSLDIYKLELQRLLWPVFVYSYISLLEEHQDDAARDFFSSYKATFTSEHQDDLKLLGEVTMAEHLSQSPFTKSYMDAKYRLSFSVLAYSAFVQFLESKAEQGGRVMLLIITGRIKISMREPSSAEPGSLAAMLSSTVDTDLPLEDEGIAGLPKHGSSKAGEASLPKVKLGKAPMEAELLEDVRAELAEEDARNPPLSRQPPLVAEFESQIKREEGVEWPNASEVPLPPSTARDVAMEVQKIKENRDRFVLDTRTGGAPPAVSCVMYTFHNTHNSVNVITISPDNCLVAVGTSDSYIRVWSLDGSELTSKMPDRKDYVPSNSRRLIGHSAPVYGLSFSPGADNRAVENHPDVPSSRSRALLSCSADKTIRLWWLDTWTSIVIYSGHNAPVWDVKWGPFGHYFLTGSMDKTARLWTTNRPSPARLFVGHDQDVDVVAWHPNSAYVFTGSSDKTVRMWSISSGDCVRLFVGHTANVTALSCSPTGKTLASGDISGSIFLWDLTTGKRIKRMRGHKKGGIWSMDWSFESKVLVSGGHDGTVRTWDVDPTIGDQAANGGIVSDSNITNKSIDANAQGATQQSGAGGPTGTKKKGKEVVVTPDQISAFATKRTPVIFLKFTQGNLVLSSGRFEG